MNRTPVASVNKRGFLKIRSFMPSSASLALSLFIAGSAPGTDIPEIVARAKPSVVQVLAYNEEGDLRTGTGWFAYDGCVITNFHVIAGADLHQVYAKTASGKLLRFQGLHYWSFDPDLAGLMIDYDEFDRNNIPASLDVGDSSTAREGQRVLVIGNPEGLEGTVSDGIISAFRDDGAIIQITAPISPGSSGSPVLDESGKVIGVATYVGKEGQNLNFAVSVNALNHMIVKYFDDINDDAKRDEPASEASLQKMQSLVDGAYANLLSLLGPQQRHLLEEDQFLWLISRRVRTKPNSRGSFEMTKRRADELFRLCAKYSR